MNSAGSIFVIRERARHVGTGKDYWISKLHGFLTINDRNILTHAGKISHDMAREIAEAEYDKFNIKRIRQADAAGGEFEKAVKHLPPPKPQKGRKK